MRNRLYSFLFVLALGTKICYGDPGEDKETPEDVDVTYAFPDGGNCTKYENAILREGAKLAWWLSSHNFVDSSNDEKDEEVEFILNLFEEEVPHVKIINFDIQRMDIELDVHLDVMQTFIEDNILDYSDTNSRALEAEDDQNHRVLKKTPNCCACRACNCCNWGTCRGDRCKRRLRRSLAAKQAIAKKAELLRKLAIPIFEMLSVKCITAQNIMVLME